jgi:ribosomal protein S18 acetylase RimI-like enzyme
VTAGGTIVLRPAVPEDVGAMLRCLAALSAQDGATHRATEADYLRHGFGPNRLFQTVVAEWIAPPERPTPAEGCRIVGLSVFFPTFSTQRGTPGVFVQDLWLDDAVRGTGLGRRLLAAVRVQGLGWGAQHMELVVAGANGAAQGFYRHIGFRPLPRYAPLVLEGHPFDALEAATPETDSDRTARQTGTAQTGTDETGTPLAASSRAGSA